MKKKSVVISIVLLLFLMFWTYFTHLEVDNIFEESNKMKGIVDKGLSMNLEQTAGAGDYKQVTQSNWPGDDYVFNSELSKCENGSTLSWDNTKNVVVFSGNVSDKCYVYFDKYVLPVINDVEISFEDASTLENAIHVKVNATPGSVPIEDYNFYLGQRLLGRQNNNEFSYPGISKRTFETGKSKVSVIIRVRDKNGKFGQTFAQDIPLYYLVNYVKNQYTGTQGENSIYYHNIALTNGAGDNSYRYAGPSEEVNNFICFGSTASLCPEDNLYRIIGVIDDKVKLIKYDYVGVDLLGDDGNKYADNPDLSAYPNYKGNKKESEMGLYFWNVYNFKNTWSDSPFNKVNLNTNFLNNIGTEWANKIVTTVWKVGGNTWAKIRDVVPSVAYQNEIVNPDATNSTDNVTEYEAKIGLMYVSDYGFAASPDWDGFNIWGATMDKYNQLFTLTD